MNYIFGTGKNNRNGYTLIELMLYIGLAALILSTTAMFLNMVVSNKVKTQTVLEVEQQGSQAMQIITDTIQSADGIDSPAPGAPTQSSITLDIAQSEAAKDPSVIDLTGATPNSIRLSEGTPPDISLLTTSRLDVSNLSFKNVSGSGNSKSVKISFILNYYNPGGRNEHEYSQTFFGSASLR